MGRRYEGRLDGRGDHQRRLTPRSRDRLPGRTGTGARTAPAPSPSRDGPAGAVVMGVRGIPGRARPVLPRASGCDVAGAVRREHPPRRFRSASSTRASIWAPPPAVRSRRAGQGSSSCVRAASFRQAWNPSRCPGGSPRMPTRPVLRSSASGTSRQEAGSLGPGALAPTIFLTVVEPCSDGAGTWLDRRVHAVGTALAPARSARPDAVEWYQTKRQSGTD